MGVTMSTDRTPRAGEIQLASPDAAWAAHVLSLEGGPLQGNLETEVTPISGEATRRSNLESCAGSPEANSGTERDMWMKPK